MSVSDAAYFNQRAEAELAMAKRARCPEASRLHHQLADAYQKRLSNVGSRGL